MQKPNAGGFIEGNDLIHPIGIIILAGLFITGGTLLRAAGQGNQGGHPSF